MIDSKDDGILPIPKNIKAKISLVMSPHDRRPHSVSSYMIKNRYGYICGGNIRVFIFNHEMRSFDYPTVFGSPREAQSWLRNSVEVDNAQLKTLEYISHAKL